MSTKVDNDRKLTSHEARVERGKAQLRLAQLVLTAYVEGLGIAETARRIQRSPTVAWELRVWLGVQSGRQHKAGVKPTGRHQTRKAIEELRP